MTRRRPRRSGVRSPPGFLRESAPQRREAGSKRRRWRTTRRGAKEAILDPQPTAGGDEAGPRDRTVGPVLPWGGPGVPGGRSESVEPDEVLDSLLKTPRRRRRRPGAVPRRAGVLSRRSGLPRRSPLWKNTSPAMRTVKWGRQCPDLHRLGTPRTRPGRRGRDDAREAGPAASRSPRP